MNNFQVGIKESICIVTVTKFRYVLLAAIFFIINPVLAVQVDPVPESEDPKSEYQKALRIFEDIDKITKATVGSKKSKDSAPTILRVFFDGIPRDMPYFSGKYNYPSGGICSSNLFQQDCYLEQYEAELLLKHKFPQDKFDKAMLLLDAKTTVTNELIKLESTIDTLNEEYDNLQIQKNDIDSDKLSTDNNFENLEKIEKYSKDLCKVHSETLNYFSVYIQKMFPWYLLFQVYKDAIDRNNCINFTKVDHIFDRIQNHWYGENGTKKVIEYMEKDQFFTKILTVYKSYSPQEESSGQKIELESLEKLSKEDLPLIILKIFCSNWGKEAEDGLIFKILLDLEKYEQIPKVIEIYGNKDPCFQCQIKLQWLADNLFGMVNKARYNIGLPALIHDPNNSLIIRYYAKNGYVGPCLYNIKDTQKSSWEITTRKKSEMKEVIKFEFKEKDSESIAIRAFYPDGCSLCDEHGKLE